MIERLKALLRDPRRDRKRVELERVTADADELDLHTKRVKQRSDRAQAEADQLAQALKKTVRVMRAEHRRW